MKRAKIKKYISVLLFLCIVGMLGATSVFAQLGTTEGSPPGLGSSEGSSGPGVSEGTRGPGATEDSPTIREDVPLMVPIPVDGEVRRSISGAGQGGYLINYIAVVYRWIAGIIASIAILMIIIAGIMMIFASGNQSVIDEAKTRILGAAYGLVFLIVSALLLWTINPGFFSNIRITQVGDRVASTTTPATSPTTPGGTTVPTFPAPTVGFSPYFDTSISDALYLSTLIRGTGSREEQYDNYALKWARQHNVNFWLVKAIITQESDWNPNAESKGVGARGLMQVMPGTAKDISGCNADKLFEPEHGIFCGTKYVGNTIYSRIFNQNYPMTLENVAAAYNGGPGVLGPSRDCAGMMVWQCEWNDPAGVANRRPNTGYNQTRDYVQKVGGYYSRLVRTYEEQKAAPCPGGVCP